MRTRLRGYRLSPAGGGLLLVAAAAIGVLVAGPPGEQTPAAVVLVVILMMLVVQPGGTKDAWSRTLGERRDDFGPEKREGIDGPAGDSDLDVAWARERERRGRDAR